MGHHSQLSENLHDKQLVRLSTITGFTNANSRSKAVTKVSPMNYIANWFIKLCCNSLFT